MVTELELSDEKLWKGLGCDLNDSTPYIIGAHGKVSSVNTLRDYIVDTAAGHIRTSLKARSWRYRFPRLVPSQYKGVHSKVAKMPHLTDLPSELSFR